MIVHGSKEKEKSSKEKEKIKLVSKITNWSVGNPAEAKAVGGVSFVAFSAQKW